VIYAADGRHSVTTSKDVWLPNHVIEASTRESYTYSLKRHLLPWFGPIRMVDVSPANVREWVAYLNDSGVSPATIRHNKVLLSAVFATALNDQVTFLNPCRGVKTPTVPVKPRRIITPEQFDVVYRGLSDDVLRLMVETAIESGLRWGELTELRGGDLDRPTRILTVSRAVVEVNPKYHPTGGRFLVNEYPKDKEFRRLKLSRQMVDKLTTYITARRLKPHDLLFAMPDDEERAPNLRLLKNPDELGFTMPNSHGRQYRHGSLSGYSAGKCRCEHCPRRVRRLSRRPARQGDG